MVFFNLSKLIQLIQAAQDCPTEIPRRDNLLFEQYCKFKQTSDQNVSVEVPVQLDRMKEYDVDKEDVDRQKKIISYVSNDYTPFVLPTPSNVIFIASPLSKCDICRSGRLIYTRAHRGARNVVVYTQNGPKCAIVYIKHCTTCEATVYNSYTEYLDNGILMRKYSCEISPYINFTQESIFECKLLEELTEDIFICDT